jgi:PhzF family phenazine biosynthesis protein
MKLPLFQIDAFTEKVFRGNPACVCPLERWPRDLLMQAIAAENNVPETAFFLGQNGKY